LGAFSFFALCAMNENRAFRSNSSQKGRRRALFAAGFPLQSLARMKIHTACAVSAVPLRVFIVL
jgi:hypothetical protein